MPNPIPVTPREPTAEEPSDFIWLAHEGKVHRSDGGVFFALLVATPNGSVGRERTAEMAERVAMALNFSLEAIRSAELAAVRRAREACVTVIRQGAIRWTGAAADYEYLLRALTDDELRGGA